jgi:hypothetical protein
MLRVGGQLSDPLPIVADVPSQDPRLGFSEYVDALADAIRGGEPPQFTIGLYGAWGSGKSSLLAALAQTLARPSSGVLPVLFDAWRYERVDHIVVPLLHRICSAASDAGANDLAKTFKRALGALIGSLKFNVGAVSIDPSSGKAAWDGSALAPLDAAFSQPFAALQEVPGALKGTRIAVLIDDLDRCSPENVVTVLEAINLVMDVPGIIFVLALDYDVLVDAVANRYPHVSGHAFVEKIIQLPFRVPPLDVSGEDFLQDLIPNWSRLSNSLPDAVVRCSADIAELGLRRNPRQIKRFVNSFLVIDRIMRARSISVDYELLAATIALQLAWPEDHRALQDAVFLDSDDPLQTLTAKVDSDPALGAFLARFMTSESFDIDELQTVLQLTAVVVASPADDQRLPLPGPADQVRETHRQRLIEQLSEDGYEQSPRSAVLYYNARHPNVRFHFRKHNLNFERRSDDRWSMERQYLLTRELDEALEAISASRRGGAVP